MALTWLAAVLREAGLTVVEHPGWQTHARPGTWSPTYGVVHATAAPRTQSDTAQIGIVRNGRTGLLGPISNACIDRSGRWHILSAGRCNSTLIGTGGPFIGLGNTNALSTEACNDNGLHQPPEAWPAVQYQAYVAGWAAWCKRLGWSSSRLVGHKEHNPGNKSDPSFSMTAFRNAVWDTIRKAPAPPPPPAPRPLPPMEDDMIVIYRHPGDPNIYVSNGVTRRIIPPAAVPHLQSICRGETPVFKAFRNGEVILFDAPDAFGDLVTAPAPVAIEPAQLAQLAEAVAPLVRDSLKGLTFKAE